MGRLLSLALGAGALLLPAAASAVTVVKTYRIESTFAADAPIGRAVQIFTLFFDPAAATSAYTALAPVGYRVTYETGASGTGKPETGQAFNPADGIGAYERLSGSNVVLTLYGLVSSYSLTGTVPDFSTSFYVDKTGALVSSTAPSVIYATNTGLTYRSASVAVTEAVPEPATWVTMIAGFALAGAALRRTRRRPARARSTVAGVG